MDRHIVLSLPLKLHVPPLIEEHNSGLPNMIESSFCFLSGVGRRTERRWWRQGIGTWAEFLSSPSIAGIGRHRKARYDEALNQAKEHRAQEDARYFALHLHTSDQWRLYEW